MKTTNSKQEFEKMIKILKGIETSRIKQDLDSLSKKLRPIVSGNDVILFTTIIDDPKLMLEIGELVDSYSCQSYKIGTDIQSLLGYVVDANVKGVLSFGIGPKDCKDIKEYGQIKETISSGQFSYDFNPPKRILSIVSKDGRRYEIQLQKAHKRRIIRLGKQDNGKPGLFMEPEYMQTHFAQEEMSEEIIRLVNDFAISIGGDLVNKGLSIIGTRNPGGVYCDTKGLIYEFEQNYCI